MDWDARILAGTYRVMGVPAVLTVAAVDYSFTCIDNTVGQGLGGSPVVQTLDPHAAVRATELASKGLTAAQLDDARIVLNSKTWRITSVRPAPSPAGEGNGEYFLMLEAA